MLRLDWVVAARSQAFRTEGFGERQSYMNSKRPPLIILLVKRIVFFFFTICVFASTLYFLGNFQGFLDQTQRFLLKTSVTSGICLVLGSVSGIILDLWMLLRKKLRYLSGIFLYILLGVFGAAAALLAQLILVVANGNGG